MHLLYVALGSALGGVARWILGGALQHRFADVVPRAGALHFPVGTLIVNVTGSFVLGALAIVLSRQTGDTAMLRLLLMVGFCGGYTTFSTFSLDTVALLAEGAPALAAANVLASLVLAGLGTAAGMLLMRALLDHPPA